MKKILEEVAKKVGEGDFNIPHEICYRCQAKVLKYDLYHVGTYEMELKSNKREYFCVKCFLELCKDLSDERIKNGTKPNDN